MTSIYSLFFRNNHSAARPDNNLFVINGGDAVITPETSFDKVTVTIKLGEQYHKIRSVEIRKATVEMKRTGSAFNKNNWITVGSGTSAILINKRQFQKAVSSIKSSKIKRKVEAAVKERLSPSSIVESLTDPRSSEQLRLSETIATAARVFSGLSPEIGVIDVTTETGRKQAVELLKKKGYKISCVMIPEGDLAIVAKKKIEEGTYKIIEDLRSIWQRSSVVSELGDIFIGAKPKKMEWKEELLKEVPISGKLRSLGVPNILKIYTAIRPGKKVGLFMEPCLGGEMGKYIGSHFHPGSGTLIPAYRKQHLTFLLQVVDTLIAMHEKANMAHGDLKLANLLISTIHPGNPQVRVADFGLTKDLNSKQDFPPGTFPPPELLRELEQQQITLKKKKLQFAKKLLAEGVSKSQVKKKLSEMPGIEGVAITPAVDKWALGVLIYAIMHGESDTVAMSYDNGSSGIKKERIKLLSKLDTKDPVDVAIQRLLTLTLESRASFREVRDLLHDALLRC